MATRTTYLNLIKPDYSDAADIADINANMDTLDDKIKGIDSDAIDDTLAPTSDSGTIRNQLSQLANRIKAATGAGGWKDNPSTTLASLATLVSNLATGSDVTWDGKKFTNTKLGISGLMDENGYVSFGKNFGGLIIQWGNNISDTGSGYGVSIDYPITFPNKALAVIPYDINSGFTDSAIPSVHAAWFPGEGSDGDGNDRRWARVGFSGKNSVFGAYGYIAIGK